MCEVVERVAVTLVLGTVVSLRRVRVRGLRIPCGLAETGGLLRILRLRGLPKPLLWIAGLSAAITALRLPVRRRLAVARLPGLSISAGRLPVSLLRR
jgi:hypothetical protein